MQKIIDALLLRDTASRAYVAVTYGVIGVVGGLLLSSKSSTTV